MLPQRVVDLANKSAATSEGDGDDEAEEAEIPKKKSQRVQKS
jgi:hypothetical protein